MDLWMLKHFTKHIFTSCEKKHFVDSNGPTNIWKTTSLWKDLYSYSHRKVDIFKNCSNRKRVCLGQAASRDLRIMQEKPKLLLQLPHTKTNGVYNINVIVWEVCGWNWWCKNYKVPRTSSKLDQFFQQRDMKSVGRTRGRDWILFKVCRWGCMRLRKRSDTKPVNFDRGQCAIVQEREVAERSRLLKNLMPSLSFHTWLLY